MSYHAACKPGHGPATAAAAEHDVFGHHVLVLDVEILRDRLATSASQALAERFRTEDR